MTKLVVISAGLSVPSSTRILADSLATATARRLAPSVEHLAPSVEHLAPSVEHLAPSVELVETTEPQTTVIELRELAHQIADNALTGFPTGALADAVRRVTEADAIIAVTPVYTGSYSGLFKMFFDVLEDGMLEGKPVLIAATAGTARHSLVLEFAMRPLFAYLRADVVPTAVFAASEDFGAGAIHGGSLSKRIDRAAGELADKILRRGTTLPEDPFENPTPFEDLLGGLH